MTETAGAANDQGRALLALYDAALPEVYGYLLRRCGAAALAEDLTADTFVAAVEAVRRGAVPSMSVAWLITVARNKLVDHWRRVAREERMLVLVDAEAGDEAHDDWDARLDAHLAHEVLGALGAAHRSALVLRHLDGLPVAEVARLIGRTTGATEVLLVRARRAFREAYETRTAGEEDR